MKKIVSVVFLFYSLVAASQSDNFLSGGYSKAMGDASATVSDVWSVFNNQAALAFVKNSSLGVYAENKFGIQELNSGAIAFTMPTKKAGNFGLSYYGFNNSSFFMKQKFGFAYALRLTKKMSAGIGVNYMRTQISDASTDNSLFGEIGVLYYVGERTAVAAHILNPSAQDFQEYPNEKIPTVMRLGFAHQFTNKVYTTIEVETGSFSKYIFKGGISYDLNEVFAIQLGFKSLPVTNSFGLQIKTKKLIFNLSLQYMQVLDASPGISANYLFN
jgi:long-subunit fatty acid transport protein